MSEAAGQGEAGEPSVRGRFALYPQEQGAVVAYVTDLCDTCQGCGCGTRQEPLDLTPRGLAALAGKMGKLKMLKGMIKP